jgi:hypothetical protein
MIIQGLRVQAVAVAAAVAVVLLVAVVAALLQMCVSFLFQVVLQLDDYHCFVQLSNIARVKMA